MEQVITLDVKTNEVSKTEMSDYTPRTFDEAKYEYLYMLKHMYGESAVLSRAPVYKQINVSLGVYDAEVSGALEKWISACISVISEIESQVSAATNEQDMYAIDISTERIVNGAEAKLGGA